MRAPELAEGIDYSILFYGGRLLSHLSPDDPEVDDFISLRWLNRNMVILMDSDRKAAGVDLNPTKRRIESKWAEQPGFAGVTDGREIENYVDPDAMLAALEANAPKKPHERQDSKYERCIGLDASGRPVTDKVKVARWLADKGKLTLAVLDLDSRIAMLCAFIKASNGSA